MKQENSMRVLMFGWEFPPHISGGLGTACHGITNGLLQQNVEVLFVVPKLFGNEDKSKFRFISASETQIDFTDPYYENLQKQLNYIQINSAIVPYLSPEEYVNYSKFTIEGNLLENKETTTNFNFSGFYGRNLMTEVAQYALIASQIAKESNFDIIHAHDWLTFPASIVAKQISGKPLIVHIHATEYDRSGDNINQAVFEIEKRGLQSADTIITVSAFTRQILIEKYGIKEDKIKIVHNGINEKTEVNKPSLKQKKKKIVTFLGRITFQKGPDYFINAARKVLEKHPDTHFVIAGSGDMLIQSINRVAKLKLSSRFHFTGFLKGIETDQMYELSDVYVMPSVSEPFGISPLEAVRSGVPVIISKQSGVAEILINAIKVDFWDTDAMADAICGLLNYAALSKTFSREGIKELENLKWEKTSTKIKKIYQELTIS